MSRAWRALRAGFAAEPVRLHGADLGPRRSRRPLVVLLVLAYVLLAAGVGVVGLLFDDLGASVLAVVLALVTPPLVVGGYRWLDGREPEPWRYLAATFVWGALGAVVVALVVESLAGSLLDLTDEQLATFVAPSAEEPAKGLVLLLLVLTRRRVLDGIVDGFVYAGVAATGFAFSENILYYTGAYTGGLDPSLNGVSGATMTFAARGFATPLAHPLFSTSMGIAAVLALRSRSWVGRVGWPVLGLAVAMVLHGAWNGLASYAEGWFALYYLVCVGLLGGLITWACLARRAEGLTVERALTHMVRRGWLHPAELPYLTRPGLGRRARRHARRHGGTRARTATAAYQRLAVATAYCYDDVMRGRTGDDGVRAVEALRARMGLLRPDVRLPPPVVLVSGRRRVAPPPPWGRPPQLHYST